MKNLVYLLMMTCLFGFFASCSDDDKEDSDSDSKTWKEFLGTYKGGESGFILTVDGSTPADLQTVVLAAGTGDSAKMTLNNFVPEAEALVVDNVKMTASTTSCSFSGETTVGTTTISIYGTLKGFTSDNQTLNITVSRSIDATIAGAWKLKLENEDDPVADFRIDTDLKIEDPTMAALFAAMPEAIGRLIGDKVSLIKLQLGANGIFNISWVKQGTGVEINYKTALAEIDPALGEAIEAANIYYFTDDTHLYLALDETVFSSAETAIKAFLPEGADFEKIKSLFTNKGVYKVLSLGMKIEEENEAILLYMDKGTSASVLAFALPLILNSAEQIPEALLPVLEGLPAMIAGAGTFNTGFGFVR